jgi:NADH-quinone oxidoreductase subunit H
MTVFYMLVFPGFLFLLAFGLFAEFVDRKLYARMQHRVGPPWFQPLADVVKLAAKEEIVPDMAEKSLFRLMPVVALTAVMTAFLFIPVFATSGILGGFDGDIIVVLYLLTVPTLTFFLGGWYSRSLYSMIGAARSLTQLFAYEIPLFLSILAPSLLVIGPAQSAGWNLRAMAEWYNANPAWMLLNIPAFVVAMVALLGKLERVPFDIPEAETEIVAGSFTEYSGRLLAMFRLAINVEMVVGASLIAAVFLPFGLMLGPAAAFGLYILKVLAIVAALALLRTVFARLRIEQMINFCWTIAAPVALVQLLVNLLAKGVLR